MNTLQKTAAVLGITALAFAGIWFGVVTPRMKEVPPNYEASFSYMAPSIIAETLDGSLATNSFVERHHEHIVDRQGEIFVVEMLTTYEELLTGRPLFRVANQVRMNRKSRFIEGKDVLLFFPPHLQRKNYVLRRFPYLPEEGALFNFKGEEKIKGLSCYRFSFHAEDLDWTVNYPNLALPEGVSVLARDWGTVWVEPYSGIIVKHEERWEAFLSGGKCHGDLVDAGEMWFLPDSIIRQVFIASNERRRLFLHMWVAPGSLTLIGGILLFMAWPFHRGCSR